ncbi:kynurenine formamidase [Patella vulgata]|uniref:kynurenine formamidase n=1 Tax=Patella vulgata TaxID=6465 RepID=UPI00217FA4C3|nr:kynurenine formamidase [Patella vulgata]
MADTGLDLEYHYSPSKWSHRYSPDDVIDAHIKFIEDNTKTAKWCLEVETDICYGKTQNQKLDVYIDKNTNKKGSPIFVYIHGGYWQALSREISGFMAPPLAQAGATVVAIGYDLAPTASMDEIVLQVKRAMAFIFKLAKERQSSGIYLCGHSAGAHLAAMMLTSEFEEDDAFDCELIKGAVLVSGIYDLRPLVTTSINEPLKLTREDAWRFSPSNFINEIARMCQSREINLAVGEYDPPEFRRQTGEMEKSLRDKGVKTKYYDIPDTDHFNIVEKLHNAKYTLTQACLEMMGLLK